MDSYETLMRLVDGIVDLLDNEFDQAQVKELVHFSAPVSPAAVAAAEGQLGCKLPPSYVAFVTTHGTFTIDGTIYGMGSGNDTELFAPEAIVEQTLRYREELERTDDDESKAILGNGVLFCAHPRDEAFYLFVLSSRTADGEMAVHHYDYQDPANSEPWSSSFPRKQFDAWLVGHGEGAIARLPRNIKDISEELANRA